MDLKRARQIINSEETIEVLHNGTPVWIESLNPENFTATVKPLDGRGSSRQVPLDELKEDFAVG